MSKKRLRNLVLLSTIMGMVVGGNVAYAGISGSFANDADVFEAYHDGNKTVFSDYVVVSGGGHMYYPDMTYHANNVVSVNKDKTVFEYKKGFLVAAGFADADKNDAEGRAKINKVYNNDLNITNLALSANGFIEFTGGYLGHYASGEIADNNILIENSTIKTLNKSSVGIYGTLTRNGNGVSENNSVTIRKSSIENISKLWLYGAVASEHYDPTKMGYVKGNKVLIESSKIDTKNASEAYIVGAIIEREGDATNNSVTITGSENSRSEIENANIYGAMSTSGDAKGNIVDLSYANLANNMIVAGYADGGDAIDNTLNIRKVNLAGSDLIGGYADGVIQGNTLNVGEDIEGKLGSISGFNTINFESLDWENGGTVLTTENLTLLDGAAQKDATSVYVKGISGGVNEGEYMNLIVSDNTIEGSVYNAGETQRVKAGVSQFADIISGSVEQEPNVVKFVIDKTEVNPQINAVGNSFATAGAIVSNGGDLVVDSLDAMICDERIGTKTFAQVHGSDVEFGFGKGIDAHGWGAMAGIGETTDRGLTYGVFYEMGKGDYSTYAQQDVRYLRGDGDVEYSGGGFLARQYEDNGVYYEGSVRAGNMDHGVEGALLDSSNELTGYNVNNNYFGMHLGVGKVIPRGEGKKLDVFGKFFYTHLTSSEFVIDGDRFNIDHLQSNKMRVGARYNTMSSPKLRSYYGLMYEYEFDGESNGKVNGRSMNPQSFGGSTFIGEVGIHYNADARWCIDANIQGYEGARDGIGGRIQVNYLF